MRISDWSSDVCSSDLAIECGIHRPIFCDIEHAYVVALARQSAQDFTGSVFIIVCNDDAIPFQRHAPAYVTADPAGGAHNNGSAPFHRHGFGNIHHRLLRSEEHTSELQSLMRISYAVFCLKKNTHNTIKIT